MDYQSVRLALSYFSESLHLLLNKAPAIRFRFTAAASVRRSPVQGNLTMNRCARKDSDPFDEETLLLPDRRLTVTIAEL